MSTAHSKPYRYPDLIWTPAELHERAGDPNVKVVDVRCGEAYAIGHIPGAHHFSVYGVNTYDTDPAPLVSFTRMWASLLGQCGVSPADTIVVYEDTSGGSAARAFWFLEYLGHTDTHLLDGGLGAWSRVGLPVTRDTELPKSVPFAYEPRPDRVATYQDMFEAITVADRVIVDTRSDKEWRGIDARATRNGTIPGAVHLEWTRHVTGDGTMRPADELRALFEKNGITPDREVLPFCNTGYRSAHAYLALRLLGYPRVRNYVGSWQEWGNREGCPVVVPGP